MHPPNGKLKIEYYGHMAFKLTSPQGITVVVDPWRNDPSGVWGVWYKLNFPTGTRSAREVDGPARPAGEFGAYCPIAAGDRAMTWRRRCCACAQRRGGWLPYDLLPRNERHVSM